MWKCQVACSNNAPLLSGWKTIESEQNTLENIRIATLMNSPVPNAWNQPNGQQTRYRFGWQYACHLPRIWNSSASLSLKMKLPRSGKSQRRSHGQMASDSHWWALMASDGCWWWLIVFDGLWFEGCQGARWKATKYLASAEAPLWRSPNQPWGPSAAPIAALGRSWSRSSSWVSKTAFALYIYMGVDQNIVAGVLLEMTLRPPLRFLALFRVFIVFHYID